MKRFAALVLMGLLCLGAAAWAVPGTFELREPLPPIIEDSTQATDCTAVYLVADTVLHDVLAVRMRITPKDNDRPKDLGHGAVMPCPERIPPRVSARALDACIARADDPKSCVFSDMGREFRDHPNANNTAENTSRCTSDKATDIGIACFHSGKIDICGVGCGFGPDEAIKAAVARCESRHQRSCPVTGSLPVLAPK